MVLLKQKLDFILDIVPSNSKVAYLDYPVHGNIGDLLIMKGTEKFFADHNIQTMCSYSLHNFPPQIRFPLDTTLVFQGGGNLGDLYYSPQEMREYFIQRYKNHRIVILPQTVYFQNPRNLERASKIFRQHTDLHIFTRDTSSFEIAKEFLSDNVYLMPDMAHALWPIKAPKLAESKCLYLLRTDMERRNDVRSHNNSDVTDWPDLINRWENLAIKVSTRTQRLDRKIRILPVRFLWSIFSQHLINKAIKLFRQYSYVETSRLHGHILACLMNKPNCLIDNSYGKNYMYYKTWTHRVSYAKIKNDVK